MKENNNRISNSNKVESTKQDIVSITYEEIGFFPRSFSRVLDRFLKQVFSDVENLVIQEYRFYRYLFLTTLKCVLILFFVPFLINFLAKTYFVRPLTEYFWNTQQNEIFLNSYQQKRAFTELKDFEEKLYFESLISSVSKTHHRTSELLLEQTYNNSQVIQNESLSNLSPIRSKEKEAESSLSTRIPLATQTLPSPLGKAKRGEGDATQRGEGQFANQRLSFSEPQEILKVEQQQEPEQESNAKDLSLENEKKGELFSRYLKTPEKTKYDGFEQRLQEKTIELAVRYNSQSIEAITNFFADLLSFITLCYLLFSLEIQINITKSFLLEVFFGLDDSKKSLLILLITDLLVGYHSSNLWELFFEFLFNHYGLPESQTGIFLLVATLPVLLDVLFKYLIFRHLNRSSPATVATYHAMIE